jgi:hypothetical protein
LKLSKRHIAKSLTWRFIGVIFVPVTGELYFSSKEIGAFKVNVNLEAFDVVSLLSKASKLPFKEKTKHLAWLPVDLICL